MSDGEVCGRRITLALVKKHADRLIPGVYRMFVYDSHITVEDENGRQKEVFRPRDRAMVDDSFVGRCVSFMGLAGYGVVHDEHIRGGKAQLAREGVVKCP